jgi:hypothetical protein
MVWLHDVRVQGVLANLSILHLLASLGRRIDEEILADLDLAFASCLLSPPFLSSTFD